MATNESLSYDNGDINRISRDYAVMRLEIMEQSDLLGFSEVDFKDLANEFHIAQCKLLSTLNRQERSSEFEITVKFDTKMKHIKQRFCEINSTDKKCASNLNNNNSEPQTSVKLPKISIEPFDSTIDNWISFIQLFDSLVHNRTNISNVEKLHYLLSSVQGKAYELIKNYPVTNENYMNAYETLTKYYNRQRQIATIYYEKMLYCEPIKFKSSSELERIYRTFSENLAILEKYKLPDKNFMLFHLLWSKLDKVTKEAFQLDQNTEDIQDSIPKFEHLQKFIEKHYKALELSGSSSMVSKINQNNNKGNNQLKFKAKSSLLVSHVTCIYCTGQHSLAKCEKFIKLNVKFRFDFVKEKRLCLLCFSNSHTVKQCRATYRCEFCNYSHHSLLHFDKPKPETSVTENETLSSTVLTSVAKFSDKTVLFSTAKVLIKDGHGNYQPVRVLLDCASACNFISESCVNRLQLPITKTQQSISGIGHSTAQPLGSSFCEIKPINSSSPCNFNLKALVLSSICAHQPSQYINSADWSHINKLSLADSDFDRPGPIDMLLSAGVFASALLPGLRKGKVGQPRALRTVFGWIIMGECNSADSCQNRNADCYFVTNNSQCNISNLSLDNNIKRFWEIENVTSSSKLSKEDQICEQYFVKNSHRNHEGRFIVPLPFIDPNNKPIFSNSREIAMRRFLSLENKLKNNFEFRQLYTSFMEDYETCGHLKEVNVPISSVGEFYYIPHHGILRPESVTTPLRVVFDASAKDANNLSLNDTLLPGPKLQLNITDLLLRFRWHSVVFTGDIKQMYRQIMVSDKDSEYQRILWRSSPDEPIRDYKLLTVTYGVSSAPYQALRTIAQVAENSATEFPSGSAVLSRDIYVDDVVSGAESVEKALSIRSELTKMLSSNGFHLRKWTSNHKDFLNNIKPSDLYSEEFRSFEEASDVTLKILGLLWIPSVDCFTFKVAEFEERRLTKRTILSDIARIYDPLGFLGPVTFYAKYLMQLLWTSGVSWDSDIPEDIAREWSKFKSQLSSLSSISITRRMVNSFVSLQFHGFCDASERGYCAVVYCRSVDANGCCSVEFCCAKTKVAPLRKLSLPRLELQAAVLLADLINSVLSALKPLHDINNIFAWSDSTVALSWIKSCPSKWQTFVANRVSHIQDIVSPECWHHVSTNFNPADGGSRGMHPADLVKHKCWWKGPVWLSEPEENWPESLLILPSSHDVQAEQKILCLQTSSNVNFVDQLLNKFSLLITLKRVLSFCFRFIHNSRRSSSNEKNFGPLLSSETNKSFMYLIKYVQQTTFSKEIDNLKRNRSNLLPKSLRKLSLFLDVAGLLRVGGRLANANVNYNVKHPLLLPRDHRLTHLIIDDCHKKFMHPGAQTLQNILAQNFWILSPKRAIRSVIAGCMKCFRAKPQPAPAPLMGNLPAYRINQIKPFSNVVVDYGGPFDIALGRGRGVKTYKGYICVFVCTATKAIHLELASELTTEAFLAALKRFIARRGRCSHIISDQGRNFVGASNYLASIMKEISESQEIKFSLSPPGSPHFNGLAEAGIKSVKAHLVRVIGLQRLTFEEFYTILTQIESMLNSRPLSPLSSDANDFSVLTPGHFLTLEPLSTIPEENITNQTISILQRWKLVKKIHQDFWRRYQREYIHTLNQKAKWDKNYTNIAIGTLVLIVNEQSSPLKWTMGRIIALHPGHDGVCRVVTVKTVTGQYKRPVVKICPLPICY